VITAAIADNTPVMMNSDHTSQFVPRPDSSAASGLPP